MKKNAELYAGALKKKVQFFFSLISIQGKLSDTPWSKII